MARATLKSTYTYDAFERLRVKALTSPVSTTHYVWDSFGHIIAEHNGSGGAVAREYVWLGDTPLALVAAGRLYYVHPDHLDRPVIMTNATAMTVAWTAKYDPFGNAAAVTAAITNNTRLPGQVYQIEDGLSYNWHRTYDPTIGRYTQADPLGFVDGPNIYNYAQQNPVMGVDPKGLTRVAGPMSTPKGPSYPQDGPQMCAILDCGAALMASQQVRERSLCLRAYFRCKRYGIPTIFAPGIVGEDN